jgi:hypothetical protein
MARACMRSLGVEEGRGDALVEPFDLLLSAFSEELGRHRRFLDAMAKAASARGGGTRDVDERELLEWVRSAFSHLRTAGLGSDQHVQLKLRDVFVGPAGQRERRAARKWSTRVEEQRALLDDRLRNGEIDEDEHAALVDRLTLEKPADARPDGAAVDVVELARTTGRLVVLGEPGSGKTTLLRWLALSHADMLLASSARARGARGQARVPLYVRAGEFARWPRRDEGLRAFIAPFMTSQQCPVGIDRLEAVIDTALRSGRCLLLIDGLDEVTSAQERARVVQAIRDFVVAQHPRGNTTSPAAAFPGTPRRRLTTSS